MRSLDNAVVHAEVAGVLRRLIIEAPTGEQFLVELSADSAAALAAQLTQEAPAPAEEPAPQPAQPVVEPQPPEPAAPAVPETAAPDGAAPL